MALFSLPHIAIKGVAACVPREVEHNETFAYLDPKERAFLIKTIGVERKRKVSEGVVCSDLCLSSAQTLLQQLDWSPADVDILVYVSQSRDYLLPCTAIVLQDRLGLPRTAMAFDVPLGCSGYVYGLSVIAGMMSSCKVRRGLLLAGDMSTFTVSPVDKKTFPLFGDAGSATALEFSADAPEMHFQAGSDGSGYETIIIPGGGCREPLYDDSHQVAKMRQGYQKGRSHLAMDGLKVFDFSINVVPESVKELLHGVQVDPEGIDYFLMHQANLLMNETIRKKLKIPASRVPYSLKDFGNTSSASIPLTMVTQIREPLAQKKNTLLLSGFGVGLSWASSIIQTKELIVPPLIEHD